MYFQCHFLSWPCERIAQATASPSDPFKQVSRSNTNVITFALEDLFRGVLRISGVVINDFLGPAPRFTAIYTPWLGNPSVVMEAELSSAEETVQRALRVSTTIKTGTPGIRQGFIRFYSERVVEFYTFRG